MESPCGIRSLLFVLLFSCLLPFVTPFIDQICVNLGYENMRDQADQTLYAEHNNGIFELVPYNNYICTNMFQTGTTPAIQPLKSTPAIGGGKYKSFKHGPATMSFNKKPLDLEHVPDNQLEECSDITDTTKSIITMYAVKHNGKYLNGWMGFDVNILEEVIWAFVQVSDERGNAVGEFVTDPPEETCGGLDTSELNAANAKKEQFLPCTATSLQDAKPSQAVVYTKKEEIEILPPPAPAPDFDKFLASPNDPKAGLKMKFTWRLNEYYCNRHSKFRVVLYFLTEPGLSLSTTYFHRADWLHPKWFGVADIIPKSDSSGTGLTCTEAITQTMVEKAVDFWINYTNPTTPATDPTLKNAEEEGPDFLATLYKSCRTYLTRLQYYTSYIEKQPSYGGRCEKMDEKKFKPQFYSPSSPHSTSSVDVLHQCLKNDDATYPPDMKDYKEYMDAKLEKRKALCADKAQKCPTLENLSLAKLLNRRRETNATGNYIMKSRAYHGMVFTWVVLFLIPISNFMARFFKETFLADDFVGVRVWYFVHVAVTFLTVNLCVSGLISNGKVTRVWGRSWSAAGATHRAMGWISMALFVLVVVLGPLRPQSPRPRLIVMIAHAFLGYFQYFMALFTLMNSALIPGSPSATKCYKKIKSFDPFVSPKFSDTYDHQISTAVTWWIFLDLFFHGLMSFMQWKADKAWEVSRSHYFPLVPIVGVNDRKSFKCFRYRTFVLIIYAFILSIIVIITCQRLYETDWRGCDCGPMTCTHGSLDPASAYSEVQCGRLASIRAKKKAIASTGSTGPDQGSLLQSMCVVLINYIFMRSVSLV